MPLATRVWKSSAKAIAELIFMGLERAYARTL